MEQLKSILIIVLVLASAVLWFKPAPYVSPEYIEIPAVIDDSTRQRIISNAKVDSISINYVDKIRWNLKDSLRIQDSLYIDTLSYVSILTDSAEYRLSQLDSTLGVGFDLKITLSDTVILEPYNVFVHDFVLDSLVWKVDVKPETKLSFVELVLAYPLETVALVGVSFIVGSL